ncbi:MAG: hypothetical protein J6U26_01385, partial [Lachnospiraceae bacterium]|nr:hypothetical protein [Lachnospiraceae bacterium]
AAYRYFLMSGDAEVLMPFTEALLVSLKRLPKDAYGLPALPDSFAAADTGDARLLAVGLYYKALSDAAYLAAVLGLDDAAPDLEEAILSVRDGWRSRFPGGDGFRSPDAAAPDAGANALLVLSGLVSEEDYEGIIRTLAAARDVSPRTERYVLEALCVMDRTDLAMERLIGRFSSMTEDAWNLLTGFDGASDLLSLMNNVSPAAVLSGYVSGVRPLSDGFKTFVCAPQDVVDSLIFMTATVRGQILLELQREGDAAVLTVTAPGGGYILAPETWGDSIHVSGGGSSVSGRVVFLEDAGVYTVRVR